MILEPSVSPSRQQIFWEHWTMSYQPSRYLQRLGLVGLSWLGVLGGQIGVAIASDTILLRYRSFGRAVPVADLALLAETGEVSDSIDGLLDAAGQDPQVLGGYLSRQLTADPVLLDRTLHSWPGEWALDQMAEVIHPPSGRASREALRSAMILSAADDQQLSLLEILQNYPTPQVVLEGDRLEAGYRRLAALLEPLSGL